MVSVIHQESEELYFLKGGGEISEIIKTINWEDTCLGPIYSWPANLKMALSIMLNSRFPMFLYWGPELICFYNNAYRPSLGDSGKHPAAIGQAAEKVWPEIWPQILPIIENIFNGGEARLFENLLLPIYRNNALEDVYWTFSYSAVLNETGNCDGVFGTCTETTENVKTLNELKESKEELEFAINAADLASWEFNPETRKISCNQRLKEWFGFENNVNIDLSLAVEMIADKDRQNVLQAIEYALDYSSGGIYNIEFLIINPKDRKERIVLAKGKTLFDSNQRPVRFNGILQDVTDERQTLLSLTDAEERARLAVDAVNLGTYDMNLVTGYMSTSDKFRSIFGFNYDARQSQYVAAIHPEDRGIRLVAHRRAFESGQLFYEVRVVWPDQSIHWIRIEGKVFYTDSIKPVRIIGTVLDISDRVNSQAELVRINKELEASLIQQQGLQRQKDDFIGVASHELKTPVTSLKAYTQVLEKMFAQKGELKEATMMSKMDAQLNRLTSLIGDLLDVTKINSGKLEFKNNHFDLVEMLKLNIEDLQRTTQKHQVKEDFEEVGIVFGDKERIGQVLTNLITNAIKYSPAADEILVSCKRIDGEVVVSVQDFGIGIPQDNYDKVFEQFYRVSGTIQHTFSGLGLGLYISSEIIRRQGGKLWLDSKEGQGSTFYFSIRDQSL